MDAVTGLICHVNITKLSLSQRLVIAVSLVLTAFLGLSAISLNNAFQASAESAQKTRLLNYVYMLLSASDLDDHDALSVHSERLAEKKFTIPNSGLYAQITSGDLIIWQSPSAIGRTLNLPDQPGPSEEIYSLIESAGGSRLLNLAFGTVWENEDGQEFDYTIHVAEDLSMIEEQTADFKLSLWYWLGGTGVVLLIIQWSMLRWGLRPLQKVAVDLHAIETGKHSRLSDDYPAELTQLTRNINNLLDHEAARRQRYKNSLADLAHSLKTPLAVFRGALEGNLSLQEIRHSGQEQLDRISALVDYQLQRAATEGTSNLLAPVSLGEVIHKITNSLAKVYQDKRVHLQSEIARDCHIHADEGDLYELLGNLLENAYKYCQQQINIMVQSAYQRVFIIVEDDGNGVPAAAVEDIIKRGTRIDTQVEGQGLGLAIVKDIIEAYEGEIRIERSHLGGARFIITLPDN